jgi:hypothetical protein
MRWLVNKMKRGEVSLLWVFGIALLVIFGVLIASNHASNKFISNISTLPNNSDNASTFVCTDCDSSVSLGVPTKTSGCSFDYLPLPDPACSTGDIFPNATKDVICVSGYSASVRDVPQSEKDDVYAEYGVVNRQPYEYEIDHIVSLELGGSNDISNLYPEKYNMTLGARVKDKVENCFHRMVCDDELDLSKAQFIIATNWTIGLGMCNITW